MLDDPGFKATGVIGLEVDLAADAFSVPAASLALVSFNFSSAAAFFASSFLIKSI